MTQYTDRKVYHRLAAKLPNTEPTVVDMVRFSVFGDTAGIAAQRAAHYSIYGTDPAIVAISALPDEAWDPARPEVGASHGITWVRLDDLHHSAVGEELVAATVDSEDHLLVNVTLSATTKHIVREDGEDENGYTRLVLAVLNHYPSLKMIRWADDVTRAGRDAVDWAQIKSKCKLRDIAIVLGGRRYDLKDSGDELALGALGLAAANDDPERRKKLTGKRLLKYLHGGAAIAENQMPHGWHHKKDQYGRAVDEGDKGLVPEGSAVLVPVLQALYRGHATGETYQQLAQRMIDFEAAGLLHRRDHKDLGNTYAVAADDPLARYDIAKSVFVRTNFRPSNPPSEKSIQLYLDGEDPAEVFDAEARLFIAKVELVRTGHYFRRLKNDIRGRNYVLNGIPAMYADDRDEYGWFDVLSAPWPWPLDDVGQPIIRFGLSDEICRAVAARLLRELRAPRATTGGRAHLTADRRVLQRFENWFVQPGEPGARYDDEPTEFGVEARCNNSGKENFILLFRRGSVCDGARVRTGWSNFGAGERKPDHIAATGCLKELTASVAHKLDRAVRELLDPTSIAVLAEAAPVTVAADPRTAWSAKLEQRQAEAKSLKGDIGGLRTQAGRKAAEGDFVGADRYDALAAEKEAEAAALAARVDELELKIWNYDEQATSNRIRDELADVSVAAYLVAGLERAASNRGRGPSRLGALCDTTFTRWSFATDGEEITWSCVCVLPLAGGGDVELPLTGAICNVRDRAGKSFASTQTVIRYLFEEGRDLDEVAAVLDVSRKGLLVRRVMPWLVEHGISSRGAKCALVDHPLDEVRRLVHRAVTSRSGPSPARSAYEEGVAATYLDPKLEWGDAAVPDEIEWIERAVAMLGRDAQTRRVGLPVLDVALTLGRSEQEVRHLVVPLKRSAGFDRPQYLRYADSAKSRVALIECSHQSCRGRRFADHVVLLPEVAASGFGVLCSHCRRAPSPIGPWPRMQFPETYLQSWTNVGDGGNLRSSRRTVGAPASRNGE